MRIRLGLPGLILVTIVGGALVLASCSTTTAPSATSGNVGQSTKPYGSLTIAGQFGTGNLDPAIGEVVSFDGLSSGIIDTLAYYNAKDELVGAIAERWEISPDGKTQTFFIRRGVKFHDGSDLTGADVKFSIERMLKPTVAGADTPAWRAAIDSVELKDDYTVLLRMKQPRFELLAGIESQQGAVMPKKYIEEKGEEYYKNNFIGSGPWKLVKFETGTRQDLQAVENHWRETPKFERVTLLNVKEEASKVAMLKTGELDMAVVGPDSVPSLEAAGLRIIRSSSGQGSRYYAWPWYDLEHPDSSPLGNVKVRKAIQLGIDSKEMADKLFRGFGGPFALLTMRPTATFMNDPSQIKADPYDPEGAKKLLAEAGYPNGFETKLWDVGAGGQGSTVNMALAGYWRKIGINAQVVPIDWNAMRTKYRPKVVPEVWGTVFTYPSGAPLDFGRFATFFHSKQGANGNTNNSKLDELIELVPATLDSTKKKQYATEAAVLAKNSYTTLSVVEVEVLLAIGPKVGEVKRMDPRPPDGLRALTYESVTHPK